MGLEYVVYAFVEAMLPRGSDDKIVLVMSFDIRVQKRDDHDGPFVWRRVHLMFHRPDNFTKVLWNVSGKVDNFNDYTNWEIRCDHDSAWRTDGISSQFFQLIRTMKKELDQDLGFPDLDISVGFSSFTYPKIVRINSYRQDRGEFRFRPNKFLVEYID